MTRLFFGFVLVFGVAVTAFLLYRHAWSAAAMMAPLVAGVPLLYMIAADPRDQ